jgi:DNA-directed RNA polymerase alpha subunit
MRSSSAVQLQDEEVPLSPELQRRGLSRLGLPARLVEAAQQRDVFTLGDLLRMSPRELRCLRGVGPLTLWEAQEALAPLGVKLPIDVRRPPLHRSWPVIVSPKHPRV